MNSKTYKLPNGKKAVFEYDVCGIGKITLECMDELMGMIADRPQGEWIQKPRKVYLPRDCEPLFEETYNEADHSTVEYWWHCNQCDYEADRSSKPTFKFCPNCGRRMKGADDE